MPRRARHHVGLPGVFLARVGILECTGTVFGLRLLLRSRVSPFSWGSWSFTVQIGGIFNSPVPQFPHCWIAHLHLLSLVEKHKRHRVKAEIFW